MRIQQFILLEIPAKRDSTHSQKHAGELAYAASGRSFSINLRYDNSDILCCFRLLCTVQHLRQQICAAFIRWSVPARIPANVSSPASRPPSPALYIFNITFVKMET